MLGDRGVSEVLGYIIIFTMVAFAVSLAYVYAVPEIQKQQEYSLFKSMESAFLTFKTSSELVAFGITPSKVLNVKVENGVLYTTDEIKVTVNGLKSNALVYELGGNRIILLANTLFECFDNDCIAITKSTISKEGEYVYLTLINFQGNFALSGYGTISFKNNGSTMREFNDGINITFDAGNLSHSLAKAFQSKIGFGTLNGNNVSIDAEKVIVSIHNVTVY